MDENGLQGWVASLPSILLGGQNKRALTWTICQIATAIALTELRFPANVLVNFPHCHCG